MCSIEATQSLLLYRRIRQWPCKEFETNIIILTLTILSLFLPGKKSSGSIRQRRTGGFTSQGGSIDIADRMFLGGRIQSNLPTVQEEENENHRQSVASTDSSFSQVLSGGQDGSSLEAEATHQLVTLVMDFLSYPGAEKGAENSSFVKTESYEVVQMSHYLGVLMGYDIKVGEFTGNPRRLRYGLDRAHQAGAFRWFLIALVTLKM